MKNKNKSFLIKCFFFWVGEPNFVNCRVFFFFFCLCGECLLDRRRVHYSTQLQPKLRPKGHFYLFTMPLLRGIPLIDLAQIFFTESTIPI